MRPFLTRIWNARRAVGFYAILLGLGWLSGAFLLDLAIPEMRPMNEPLIHRMVMIALVVYILAAAIPFVPGAEIGIALLLIFGKQASPLVFAGMVSALVLSYTVARLVPLHALGTLAGWLHLSQASDLVADLAEVPPQERSDFVASKLYGRLGHGLLRNRYVVLAVLLNLPGNSLLGGGGGLAFLAGISGLYRFWWFLLSVVIAVAPLPLAIWMFGG